MVFRTGTAYRDNLLGTVDDDTLYGFDQNDRLTGDAGNDFLNGGTGSDVVFGGAGNDTLIGDLGGDRLYGGDGNDWLQLNDPVYHGGSQGWGGNGDDFFGAFDTGDVWAYGGGGRDTLGLFWLNNLSGAGAHIDISTGSGVALSALGNHAYFTSIERLVVLTGPGDDTLVGRNLDDVIDAGAGANQVDGKAGNDTIGYQLGSANTLDGGLGVDTLVVWAGANPVYFIVDTYDGDVDDGQLSSIHGFERYTVYGGSQADIISMGNSADAAWGYAGQDTLFGMGGKDSLYGGDGDDQLIGGDGADQLNGGRHNDRLEGGAGNDALFGGTQYDELYGGDGNDRLNGGDGTDTLTGGDGADVFRFNTPNPGWDLITDFTTGEDRIEYMAASLGVFAPPLGQLQAEDMPVGGLRTDPGIFVLVYDPITNQTDLQWTDDGHGTFSLMRFEGNVTLSASDIYLI